MREGCAAGWRVGELVGRAAAERLLGGGENREVAFANARDAAVGAMTAAYEAELKSETAVSETAASADLLRVGVGVEAAEVEVASS